MIHPLTKTVDPRSLSKGPRNEPRGAFTFQRCIYKDGIRFHSRFSRPSAILTGEAVQSNDQTKSRLLVGRWQPSFSFVALLLRRWSLKKMGGHGSAETNRRATSIEQGVLNFWGLFLFDRMQDVDCNVFGCV